MSGTIEIPLTRGKVALIDAADSWVAEYKWYASKDHRTWYAVRRLRLNRRERTMVRLHRLIMAAQPDQQVDHISGNGLDCRRSNLRLTDFIGNGRNRRLGVNSTSGFKGAWPHKGKWQASIKVAGRHRYLGCFGTAEEAARAYDAAAIQLYGEFARLNFPLLSAGGAQGGSGT